MTSTVIGDQITTAKLQVLHPLREPYRANLEMRFKLTSDNWTLQ